MADALIVGAPAKFVSQVGSLLSETLGVPLRHQRGIDETAAAGVAICASASALSLAPPILVFADGERSRGAKPRPERVATLRFLAEAVAVGRYVAVVSSKREAVRWAESLKDQGMPAGRPLRRITIVGESGSGKSTLARKLAPAFGLPIVSIDDLHWNDAVRAGGVEERRAGIRDAVARETWLSEGVYWRAATEFAARSYVTVVLDVPGSVARAGRQGRGNPDQPLRQRIATAALLRAYPYVFAPVLRHELKKIAHVVPILVVTCDAEREAVTEGFLAGAANLTTHAPGVVTWNG